MLVPRGLRVADLTLSRFCVGRASSGMPVPHGLRVADLTRSRFCLGMLEKRGTANFQEEQQWVIRWQRAVARFFWQRL